MNSSIDLKKTLDKKIFTYYKKYYLEELGLPDWDKRVHNRLNEEFTFSETIFKEINSKIDFNFTNKKVLVNGCGTGGELIYLNNHKQANVYGIEPNLDAFEICQIKSDIHNIPKDKFINGYAEDLPFEENTFDFIYCYTVLEHVNDVEKSIDEMIRVAKKGGYIYINAPDYRQFTERHYKVHLPMFLPRWINEFLLRLQRRPVNFLSSLQLINKNQLKKIFDSKNVHANFYAKKAKLNFKLLLKSPLHIFYYLTYKIFDISDMQEWIVKKN